VADEVDLNAFFALFRKLDVMLSGAFVVATLVLEMTGAHGGQRSARAQ
jgi:hypothetical protein